jgi:hypothetical protein
MLRLFIVGTLSERLQLVLVGGVIRARLPGTKNDDPLIGATILQISFFIRPLPDLPVVAERGSSHPADKLICARFIRVSVSARRFR